MSSPAGVAYPAARAARPTPMEALRYGEQHRRIRGP
jgi:hypothetical protein